MKSAFAQNPKVITFSGTEPPYGYMDWCPISLGFNNSVAPFDKAEFRQAINFALDRTKLVNLAESGAGVVAYHQFTPYVWFEKFDQAVKPTEQKYGLDATAHADKVSALMGKLGYTKGGDGLWAGSSAAKPNMKVAVPDWLKNYGPPLSQQLRDRWLRRHLRHPRAGLPGPDGRAGAVLWVPGTPRGERHGPVLHAVDLHLAVLPPDRRAGAISWATSRYRNPEYDAIVEKISPLSVDDPKTLDYFTQAMDLWFKDMPMVYVSQLIIRYPMNTTYWTGLAVQR